MRLDKAVPVDEQSARLERVLEHGWPERRRSRRPPALWWRARRMDYPVETFTDEERALLAPHFTNLDRPVFALVNLPETVKGALFARYSRYQGTLRRLYLESSRQTPRRAPAFDGEEGERARKLYERIFIGYGDDSVAQLGGAHIACEWVSNVMTKLLQRGRLAAYLEQSTRYMAYDAPMGEGLGYRYWRHPELGPGVRGGDGLPLRCLLRSAAARRGLGGRALPARGRRARGRARALDPGQGARPAARPAARGLALARGDLRLGPGLRAAAAAPVRLAAARGARLRAA